MSTRDIPPQLRARSAMRGDYGPGETPEPSKAGNANSGRAHLRPALNHVEGSCLIFGCFEDVKAGARWCEAHGGDKAAQ